MREKLCNVTITYNDGRSATITRLTEAQTSELSAILQTSGVWYRWQGNYHERRRRGLRELWARWWAWAMPLLVVSVLSASVVGQDSKPRVLISQDGELAKLVRDELTDSNVAVSTTKRGDYEITTALAPLDPDSGCRGLIGVLLIEGRDGKQLSAFIASDVASLARQMAQRLNEDLQKHRGK